MIVSASMPQFSMQIGSQDQIRNCSVGQPAASQASGSVALHSWVYPQSTLPSSLVSILNSSTAGCYFKHEVWHLILKEK